MQRYSKVEMMLSRAMNSSPFMKRLAKNSYYRLCSWIYSKPYNLKLAASDLSSVEVCPQQFSSSFFGYYDKSPWNVDQNSIVFHAIDYPSHKLPSPEVPMSIIVCDAAIKDFQIIGQSKAWNWQQGSRLFWISPDKVIFNDYKVDKYISKIVDVRKKQEDEIPYSINDVFQNKYALTLNYNRLERLRPDYGYKNSPEEVHSLKPIDEKDGIWKLDLGSGKYELILSLVQLNNLEPKETMENAWHKVNHIMISPLGDKFIFLHRWYKENRKFTRLIQSDKMGQQLRILLDDDMVSHCCWIDNHQIVCWARYAGRDNYYLVNTNTCKVSSLGEYTLWGDGHPSVSLNNKYLVTDTYPDKSRMRYLIMIDLDAKETIKIGEFHESLKFSEQIRCDLHPRWSPHGDFLSIDSNYSGCRKLLILSGIKHYTKE